MPFRNYFPVNTWIGTALTGHRARRVYLATVLMLLVTSMVARIYSFVLVHRIQAVISGLSKLRIDETTEEEVIRTVPYLARAEWDRDVKGNNEVGKVDEGTERVYYVAISNDSNWMRFASFAWRFPSVVYAKEEPPRNWIFSLADSLGYRYIGFGAAVVLLDGRVSRISYGVADNLVFPRPIGNIISAQSFHSTWAPHQTGFEVSSTSDENPQFRIAGNDRRLAVSFASDASPDLKAHVFQVDLRCFWNLGGCRHVRQVAPLLWQDYNAIEAATLARLKSNDPCPDRILAGRLRYLPDLSVVLLESTGYKAESMNEDGLRVDEIWTHYRLIDVLRGRSSISWDSVRSSATVPYPGDYERKLPNMGLRWADAGERVLAFSNLSFDSCRIVRATSSTLSTIRNSIPSPRRAEDELIGGLQ